MPDANPPYAPKHWLTRLGVPMGPEQKAPRPVEVLSIHHDSGFHIPNHNHSRSQLLFISEGLIHVVVEDSGYWVVPPQRAVWIPPLMEHQVKVIHSATLRNVYVEPSATLNLPSDCQVVSISPLLRELILSMAQMPTLYDPEGADGRLVRVFFDQLVATPVIPLHLPMPTGETLLAMAKYLMDHPEDKRSLAQWAKHLGLSERTLARHFRQQTHVSFGQWRQQARLLAALTRIAQGMPISHIAEDLGYQSQSAFIAMFKKAFGRTPKRYFDQ